LRRPWVPLQKGKKKKKGWNLVAEHLPSISKALVFIPSNTHTHTHTLNKMKMRKDMMLTVDNFH
jgi:hypothetical protein